MVKAYLKVVTRLSEWDNRNHSLISALIFSVSDVSAPSQILLTHRNMQAMGQPPRTLKQRLITYKSRGKGFGGEGHSSGSSDGISFHE
jgi:hypothetical protein